MPTQWPKFFIAGIGTDGRAKKSLPQTADKKHGCQRRREKAEFLSVVLSAALRLTGPVCGKISSCAVCSLYAFACPKGRMHRAEKKEKCRPAVENGGPAAIRMATTGCAGEGRKSKRADRE